MIIYQVLPRLWGGGKFSDFGDAAFEYLRSLSVDAVWYTGVPRHSAGKSYTKGNAGSPYSIEDYRDVNPYLADSPERRIEEFGALVSRTHAAGMKVFIDLVPNHASPDCRDVPLLGRYDFDWEDTRKIDYSRREAWDAMLGIVLFWAQRGVDGMRCDMVELVPREFLGWLISRVKEKYPNFVFIAEAYDRCNYRPLIEEAGFDLLYDKSGFYDIARAIISGRESARRLTSNWQELSRLQGNMLNFLENHDEQRIASPYFAGKPSKAYAALGYGALFNDASFMIYAGQELGETASEGYEGRTSIFDFVKVRSLRCLHSFLDGKKPLAKTQSAVLQKYRNVLSYARQFGGRRNWDLCYCQSAEDGFDFDRHSAFLRFDAGSGADAVLCNFSGSHARLRLRIPEELQRNFGLKPYADVSAGAFDCSVVKIL